MNAEGSRGVETLATLLAHLAGGQPVRAAQFAEHHGYARSSVFALVRRLEADGLLIRDDDGVLSAGPTAYDLAWSSHGLAGLRGAAVAVLLWLRDHTEASARLLAGPDELLAVHASSKAGDQSIERSQPVRDGAGRERLRLILQFSASADASLVEMVLRRATATLEHHLRMLG